MAEWPCQLIHLPWTPFDQTLTLRVLFGKISTRGIKTTFLISARSLRAGTNVTVAKINITDSTNSTATSTTATTPTTSSDGK
jgi:hypothetical protein